MIVSALRMRVGVGGGGGVKGREGERINHTRRRLQLPTAYSTRLLALRRLARQKTEILIAMWRFKLRAACQPGVVLPPADGSLTAPFVSLSQSRRRPCTYRRHLAVCAIRPSLYHSTGHPLFLCFPPSCLYCLTLFGYNGGG